MNRTRLTFNRLFSSFFRNNLWRPAIAIALVSLSVFFIFHIVHEEWSLLYLSISKINVSLFLLSLFLATISNVYAGLFFAALITSHDQTSDKNISTGTLLLSQIIKYIPGKIWSYVFQFGALSSTTSKTAILITNFEIILISSSILFLLSISALLFPNMIFLLPLTLLLSYISVLLANTRIIDNMVILLLKRIKHINITHKERHHLPALKTSIGLSIWMTLNFISLVVLIESLWILSHSQIITYTASMLLSWIVGLLIFIVPAGIGVREASFIMISSIFISILSPAQLAITALIVRFWQLIQDAICAILAIYFFSKSKNH